MPVPTSGTELDADNGQAQPIGKASLPGLRQRNQSIQDLTSTARGREPSPPPEEEARPDIGSVSADLFPGGLSPGITKKTDTASSLLSADMKENDDVRWVANYVAKQFSPLSLSPPVTWFPAYVRCNMGHGTDADKASAGALPFSLRGDMLAGLTVGFMLVPQSLAFAMLAGLPVQVGLYSSFMPLVVYALLGTIRQVQPGPTALMSLLTGQALDNLGYDDDDQRMKAAAFLACLVGGISVLLGVVRFGFIVDFMSHSVMAAFCSAAGVTIATSQLKHLFGIEIGRLKHWWETAGYLLMHLHETDPATFAMGGSLLTLLLTLKYWKSAGSKEKRQKSMMWRWLPTDKTSKPFKGLKLVGDMSSLLSVFVGWFWGLAYRQAGVESVKMVGMIEGSGFKLVVPGGGLEGGLAIGSLTSSAMVMAVVGFLETVAVGGKFAMQARYEYDPNQELVALGMSNAASAVMSGYPVTGSFSRTAVNAMFGATSLVAVLFSSSIVLMSVYFLLAVVQFLPLASLAPIIIQGAIGVIDMHGFQVAYRASRAEFLVMVSTFVVSLALSVKEGLLVGFVFSVLKTMSDLANPNLVILGRLSDSTWRDVRNFPQADHIDNTVILRMDARLTFANSRKLKEFCIRAVQVRENQGFTIEYVIVDTKPINHVDLTGCEMLEVLAETLYSRGQRLILANLKGPVSKCLFSAGVPKVIEKYKGHLCIDMDQAINIVSGADPKAATAASEMMQALVKRVDAAKLILHSNAGGNFYACSGPSPKLRTPQPGFATPKSEKSGDDTPKREHSYDDPVNFPKFAEISQSAAPPSKEASQSTAHEVTVQLDQEDQGSAL